MSIFFKLILTSFEFYTFFKDKLIYDFFKERDFGVGWNFVMYSIYFI